MYMYARARVCVCIIIHSLKNGKLLFRLSEKNAVYVSLRLAQG